MIVKKKINTFVFVLNIIDKIQYLRTIDKKNSK